MQAVQNCGAGDVTFWSVENLTARVLLGGCSFPAGNASRSRRFSATMRIRCEEVIHALSDHLEADASPGLYSDMEAHFRGCRHCSAVLNGTRNILWVISDRRAFELPAGFGSRLYERLQRGRMNRS